MISVWQISAAVVAVMTWLSAPATSLADAAAREAVRRQLTAKSEATLNNAGLPAPRPSDVQPAQPPPSSEDDDGADADGAEPAAPDAVAATPAAPTPPGLDERGWRSKSAELQVRLVNDEQLTEGMQSRVNALQNDWAARDDPAQRVVLQEQLSRAMVELERMKAKVEADRAALDAFRDEARRQNVPPGWIR